MTKAVRQRHGCWISDSEWRSIAEHLSFLGKDEEGVAQYRCKHCARRHQGLGIIWKRHLAKCIGL